MLTGTFEKAIAEFRKEAAYTHLNRLMGLRCLEVRDHLEVDGEVTEAIACRAEFGGRPKLLWTFRDADQSLRQGPDAEERLWRTGLTRAYKQVSNDIGVLLDRDDPYAALWPSHATLRGVIDRLNELPEDSFRADELLGWVYQYFQSEEKNRVFEEVRTKKKKVSWSDIVPVTQLYTERYMVEFLLQNSIGRRFMDMYPDSDASDAWPYYVTPATPNQRDPQPVKDWTILDPCVGSGHFLVVAFNLLVQLYTKERELAELGVIPKEWVTLEDEVAQTILSHNLYGIDIDPRSVQLAALALYLKAKDHGLSSPTRVSTSWSPTRSYAGTLTKSSCPTTRTTRPRPLRSKPSGMRSSTCVTSGASFGSTRRSTPRSRAPAGTPAPCWRPRPTGQPTKMNSSPASAKLWQKSSPAKTSPSVSSAVKASRASDS